MAVFRIENNLGNDSVEVSEGILEEVRDSSSQKLARSINMLIENQDYILK